MKKILLTLLFSVLSVGMVSGGGFGLYEFGAAASSMAGTGVANPWDASTIFYNPSGLVYLPGMQFYGGVTLVTSTAKFTGAEPVLTGEEHETDNKLFPPVGIYLSSKFGEKFAAGVGLTNPFGLGVRWKDDFPGRFISKESQLESFYISPVIAYAITENLSIGGGADIVISKVKLIRNITLFESEGSIGYEVGEATLEGTSNVAVGFTASLMYKAEKGGIGVLYRHSVKNTFEDGDATFNIFNNLSVPQAVLIAKGALKDQKVQTELTYPNIVSVGFYHKPFEKFGYEIDVLWFGWSKVDKLDIEFDSLGTSTVNLNYSDRFQIRAGVHYDVNEKLTLRGGYIYDPTPQPVETMGPLLPDADRHDFSVGLGYKVGKARIDLGYMMVNWNTRSTVEDGVGKNENNFNGTYDTKANLFFLSFGFGSL